MMVKRGFVKLVAGILLLVAGMGDVWGQQVSVSPVSPAFRKWQKAREFRAKKKALSQTNATERARTTAQVRTLSATSEETEEETAGFGLIPEMFDTSYLAEINTGAGLQMGIQDALPSRYDLREKGFLTPVRNQGSYGTCWAHAVCASLESCALAESKGAFDFSENNMANLHGFEVSFSRGGNADFASAYLLRWHGPVLEANDKYPRPGKSVIQNPSRHVQNIRWVTRRTSPTDNEAIKRAIMKYGALYVEYYHVKSPIKYNGKYVKDSTGASFEPWDEKTSSYYCYDRGVNDEEGPDENLWATLGCGHAVAVVGWDDAYSAKNFAKTPPGNGAFIVRNSWGDTWGDKGYFYVSYYDKFFARRSELYAFADTEETSNYDEIYQHDELGFIGTLPGNGYGFGANVFTAKSDTKLAAIGTYALVPNVSYKIDIYTNGTKGNPRSGQYVRTQGGTLDSPGYHTIPLSETVSLEKGQRFSVVMRWKASSYSSLHIPLEGPDEHGYAKPEAFADESYIDYSCGGDQWSDVGRERGWNVCIKAYTKNAETRRTIKNLKINGVTSLASEKSAQFQCKAVYSDGYEKTVSPTWSMTAGSAYASVNASGMVTAKKVVGQQRATVQASYTESGVTKTGTWTFDVMGNAPAVPANVTATQGEESSGVRIRWTASSGAATYAVYRSTSSSSGNATYLGESSENKYFDSTGTAGRDYYYFVKAKVGESAEAMTSAFSVAALGWRKLAAPDGVSATDTLLDKVTVTWDKVAGASYYRVYRAEDVDGEKTAISGWQAATSFDDTTAVAGELYAYYVVAAVNVSGYRSGDFSIFDDGMRAVPVTLSHLAIAGAASITSGGSATYTATAVYSDGTTKPVTPRWGIVSGGSFASVASGQVTAKVVTGNASVTLKATYTVNGETATGEKVITIRAVKPNPPTGLSVVSATAAGVSLKWTAASGAASYKVYRSMGDGTAEAVGTTTETTYVDESAIPGVRYTYSVTAVNGVGESAATAAVAAAIALSAPTGVTATQTRTDGVRVAWNAVNGATHYRVARATSASGAKTLLGTWQTLTSYLDTSAVAGTKYWYFVQAATSSAGANAGTYSTSAQGVRKVAVTLASVAISGSDTIASGGSAFYTCTATYSDGTTKEVAPTWSVQPVGPAMVEPDGCVKAGTVTSDTTVSVFATYVDGGVSKTAKKDVRIVAPVVATVEVSDLQVTTRWPFANLIDVDYTLTTTPAGTKAKVSLAAFDLDH